MEMNDDKNLNMPLRDRSYFMGEGGLWDLGSTFSHLDRHPDRECFEAKKLQANMEN